MENTIKHFCTTANRVKQQALLAQGPGSDRITKLNTVNGVKPVVAGSVAALGIIAGLKGAAASVGGFLAGAGGVVFIVGVGVVIIGSEIYKKIKEKNEAAEEESGKGDSGAKVNGDGLPINGKIKGWTKHGTEQALERDGGASVSNEAINDAVDNPEEVVEQEGGTTKYVGKDATVVLNQDGKVVTTWANGSTGTRGGK